MTLNLDAHELLERVRRQKPLVHHLTNWVTIYDCAQVVKSLGASPVMAHAPEEVGEMAGLASALVLNIGTLTAEFVEAMKLAAASANRKGIPVLLDACGAGATKFRDEQCFRLLDSVRVDIIKGNASEIARLSGAPVRTRGVDATEVAEDLAALAGGLAVNRRATVVVTGREDIVADAAAIWRVRNGHEMMTRVVGTGCMAASMVGTFAAVEKDFARASAAALVIFGIAAELAASSGVGPAQFKNQLFDLLYRLDQPTVELHARFDRQPA